ncbi:hypothetical protein B0A54_15789 [Friedmanniomyces endolithicus]|uniref:Enoyl reductase (ER) domain-containing protein n=1 Tax=Friedmanniomyces endolithicus TaxID=329885 RepID=A0A4U0U712_9PEZI|nr:hypothetical protein LTS09_015739 [Friedmanniomyces endolithicus]TKA30868.1 hypothetical protein B0A54_15789 [Friedmanniomyces endolithicus]
MATTPSKAWTFTAGLPSLTQTTTHPPRAGEVKSVFTTPHILVKINACALNPVDIQIMNLPSWRLPGANSKPKTCVCDFSGTVITGGRTELKRGDEVFGMTIKPFEETGGALAGVAQFNMAHSVAVKKPREWSHEKAAGVCLVWLTAKSCIESVAKFVDATASKRVAVLGGSSATGLYTVMLAKQRGWKVVTTSSGRNREFCTETLKVDEHVDYTKQKVRAAVQKFAPDAVIDCVGGTECVGLPSSKRYVSIVGDKTGRSSMGGPATYYDFLGPFALYHATMQWIRWARGQYGYGESYDIILLRMKKEWLEEAKSTLSADDIVVDSVFAFEDAKKAFERLNTGRARGKVVIKISDTGLSGTA